MRKRSVLFAILILFLLLGLLTAYLFGNMKKEMKIFVDTKGKAALSLTLQNALYGHMQKQDGNYVEVAKDTSNRITSIHIHSIPLSQLATEMNLLLLDELGQYESDGFGIPIGNLTSVAFLSGKGFLIPVKAVTLGTIASEVHTELTSTGINQTLHKVTIRFAVTVRYLSPLHEVVDTLYFEVLIAETLVVGEVPIYKD